jgi:hypothetical protein
MAFSGTRQVSRAGWDWAKTLFLEIAAEGLIYPSGKVYNCSTLV